MDLDMEAMFALHTDMPRGGPGSDEHTMEAIRQLPPLGPSPRIFDLACGTGKSALVLARHFQTPIVALDFHEPYLDRLRRDAAAQGLSGYITTRLGQLAEFDEPPGSIDLIWIEAAIYIMGFAESLRRWHPLLRSRGFVAASEAAWMTDDPPPAAKKYWTEMYPAMVSADQNVTTAEDCGFEVLHRLTMPQAAWWTEYYTPLRARITRLRREPDPSPGLTAALDDAELEIEICERFGESVGYIFYAMQKTS